ncbi:hypothetical protein [Opitutus sp. ER46]|uniref:hypothetical protein n=1 Tax=Opitutus sp. ER46 TaxID=2161864 RepID=UPI000D309796|nr:hypothetical protein [Opitutus sp. ER46]PTX91697.1 hypothetical protein DB354_17685 [Opitutus sp. ER46]
MKTNPDEWWRQRVAMARQDVPPPVNLPALLRVVHASTPLVRSGWADEMAALLAGRHVLAGCLAGATGCLLLTVWQAWSCWELLPWIELLANATGGVP